MNKGLDGLADLALLVVCAAIGLSITLTSIALIEESQSSGQVEKATILSLTDNPPPEPVFDAVDLTVMVTIQDRYIPVPTRISFYTVSDNQFFDSNTTHYHNPALRQGPTATIDIDSTWFPDREAKVNALWNSVLKPYTTDVPPERDIFMFPDNSTGTFQLCVVLPKR
jgi:hypothetical protein